MVVWTIVNVEDWDIGSSMPRTVLSPPMGAPLLPDLPNWAWHEYGMRVGYWRFHEVMAEFDLKPTLAINGRVFETFPRVAEAALEVGWEFMGHGYVQGPMHKLDDQQDAIHRTVEAIRLQLNSILNRASRRRSRRIRRQVAQLAARPVAEERAPEPAPVATIYSLFPPAAA